MKTAVEWLFEQMPKKLHPHYKKQFEQANKMFEEQIMDAHRMSSIESGFEHSAQDWANTYYNETYKNK